MSQNPIQCLSSEMEETTLPIRLARSSTIPIIWRQSTIPMPPSRSSTRASVGESKLLNLPVELFSQILEIIVRDSADHGVNNAMRLRYVCRTFNDEVIQTMCDLQCFESPAMNHSCYHHENTTLKYLYARTQSGRADKHHLTKAIKDTVEYIIKEIPELEDRREEYIFRLCWCAIQISDASTVESIMNLYHHGNSPKPTQNCKITPQENAFAAAAYLGIFPLAQRLLRDLDPKDADSDFGLPLNSAIVGGNSDMIELLRSHGFAYSESSYPKFLPKDFSPILRTLVEEPTTDRTPKVLRTVVLRATAIGDLDTVTHYVQVLENLASELKTHFEWEIPLQSWSAMRNDEDVFHSLYNCILYVAVDHGHLDLVQYATENGANVNRRSAWSCFGIRGVLHGRSALTPLELATKRGRLSIVRFLLDKGAPASQVALTQAARLGWVDIARTLLDQGVGIWPTKTIPVLECGFYEFPKIVNRGHVEIAKLYLDNGFGKRTDKKLKERAALGYRIAQQSGNSEILELMEEYVYDAQTGKGWLRMEHIPTRN